MNKEEYLDKIVTKLNSNMRLDDLEIGTIISALRKYTEYPQKPYYEVVYHDEYDNTERRIMEPLSSREYEDFAGCNKIIEDRFELNFRRYARIRKEEKK